MRTASRSYVAPGAFGWNDSDVKAIQDAAARANRSKGRKWR